MFSAMGAIGSPLRESHTTCAVVVRRAASRAGLARGESMNVFRVVAASGAMIVLGGCAAPATPQAPAPASVATVTVAATTVSPATVVESRVQASTTAPVAPTGDGGRHGNRTGQCRPNARKSCDHAGCRLSEPPGCAGRD